MRTPAQILAFLAKQYKTKAVSEGDFMGIIWTGVAGSVDLSSGDAAAATQALLDQLKVRFSCNSVSICNVLSWLTRNIVRRNSLASLSSLPSRPNLKWH